jgi:hypothetical protein
MQRLYHYVVLHGALGSYLRGALHDGGVIVIACILAPRTSLSLLPLCSPLVLVDPNVFFVIRYKCRCKPSLVGFGPLLEDTRSYSTVFSPPPPPCCFRSSALVRVPVESDCYSVCQGLLP